MKLVHKNAAPVEGARRQGEITVPREQRTPDSARRQPRRNAVTIAAEGPPVVYRVYARLSTALAVAGALRWAGVAAKVERVEKQ